MIKMTFIGGKPAPTSGADVTDNGPLSPAQVDQNFANLQSAVDTLAAAQTVPQSGTYTVAPTCGISGSITVSSQRGRYTRRDDTCTVYARFIVGSVSSPVGYIAVNLPVSPAVTDSPPVAIYVNGLGPGTNRLTAIVVSGFIAIYEDANGIAESSAAQRMIAGTEVRLAVTYFT